MWGVTESLSPPKRQATSKLNIIRQNLVMEGRCGDDEPSFSDVMFPLRVYFQLLGEAVDCGRICGGERRVGSGSDCSCTAWL